MGQISWFRRRSRSSKEMDHSLWFRAFLMTNDLSPASRLQPSRAHWKVATAIELPRDAYQLVNPTILEESVPTMGSFFHGVIPGRGLESCTAYKPLSGGRIRPRLQS